MCLQRLVRDKPSEILIREPRRFPAARVSPARGSQRMCAKTAGDIADERDDHGQFPGRQYGDNLTMT